MGEAGITSVKLPLYAERGVPEVWIVDVEGGRLRRHADPHEGRWRFEDSSTTLERIVPRYLDEVALDLSALFRVAPTHARRPR